MRKLEAPLRITTVVIEELICATEVAPLLPTAFSRDWPTGEGDIYRMCIDKLLSSLKQSSRWCLLLLLFMTLVMIGRENRAGANTNKRVKLVTSEQLI